MIRVAIIYGSTTCYTQMVAEDMAEMLPDEPALIDIASMPLSDCLNYDFLIFGIPTWDYGELQEDWDTQWEELESLDLRGKSAAVFGLGDQVGYADWYQDAMGYLFHQLAACGAELHGSVSTRGHRFNASQALTEDGECFVGLALDQENQPEQTEERSRAWLEQLGLLQQQ